MLIELSVTGKTRDCLSVLRSSQRAWKKLIKSRLKNFLKASLKNSPLLENLLKNDFKSQALVRLHLPLPLKRSFFPRIEFFSMIVTHWPSSLALIALIIPAGPAPTTTILFFCTEGFNFLKSEVFNRKDRF